MVIVTEFRCPVHEYVDQFTPLDFPRPDVCPHCHAVDVFIGHGFYLRKALSQTQVYLVRIKRWLCKACRHTLSLLPSFLLRYRHYLLDVIQSVVVTRFEDGASWTQVSRRCAVDGAPSPRTIRRWCVSFAAHAPAWWSAVQQTLAHHDASSPWLDPLGANAGPRDGPGALLQAALPLLAWAKTQWTEVVAYGLSDRLRFLWHWGARQNSFRSCPMSMKNVTETETRDLATEIALFRYGLIAQLVHTPPDPGHQEALLRELAARLYHIPGSKRTRVSLTTLRRYLQTYRAHGFEALRPSPNLTMMVRLDFCIPVPLNRGPAVKVIFLIEFPKTGLKNTKMDAACFFLEGRICRNQLTSTRLVSKQTEGLHSILSLPLRND